MKANVIRLFEHIKLLQREVEQFQKLKDEPCESLENGFNNKVQIGLLGATSTGKTTLIRRLLSDAAGKITPKPETACLVVHRFSKAENLILEFCPTVKFDNPGASNSFYQFLKSYNLDCFFNKNGLCEWRLVSEEKNVPCAFAPQQILNFIEEVNKYGEAFRKITWNHRQRRSDYNITDLIDIYDLPGFGGLAKHDKAIDEILGKEKCDVLIYLIDTDRGIPGKDELECLEKIQKYLQANQRTSFYWAYEKPSQSKIDLDEMLQRISDAVSKNDTVYDGGQQLAGNGNALNAKGLLDLTGREGDDDEELRSRLLDKVLKPYFIKIGTDYHEKIGKAFGLKANDFEEGQKKELLEIVFPKNSKAEPDPLLLIKMILSKLDSKERRDYSKENARVDVMSFLMGKDKTESETGNGSSSSVKGRNPQENDCTNNRECAISIVEGRIESSVAKILNGVCGIRGKVDRNAIPAFESKVFDREKRQDWKLHMLIFDLQMYWMLKDRGGVMEFIKRPMSESLFSNIENEIKAIEDFDDDE